MEASTFKLHRFWFCLSVQNSCVLSLHALFFRSSHPAQVNTYSGWEHSLLHLQGIQHAHAQQCPEELWEHRAHSWLIYPFTQYLYSVLLWQQSRHTHVGISHLYVSLTTHTRAFTANKLSLCLKIISLTNRVISCTLLKFLDHTYKILCRTFSESMLSCFV